MRSQQGIDLIVDGVAVEIASAMRWEQSTHSRTRRWQVSWADGPTVAGMTALVDRLVSSESMPNRAALVYLRTIRPVSVALMVLRNVRQQQPAPG